MGYLPLHLQLFLLLAITAAVKSQQTITCFVAANCDTNQPSQTIIQSSDAVGVCCNYPSAGVNPRGFAYRVGQGDCTACPKIFGFFNTTFSAEESSIATSLPVGYLSGVPPSSFAGVNLQVQGSTAGPNDFTVTGAVNGAGQYALNTGQLFIDVSVQHTIDGVAQEKEEQYNITLSNFINLGNYTFVGTTGTIIDTDRVTFSFSEADHSVNEGSLPAPPTITAPLSKNPDTRLACPVTFQVCPVTIDEANATGCPIPPGAILPYDPNSPYIAIDADFNTTCFNVTFPADEGSAIVINTIDTIRVAVVDDDINERFEQLFLIKVEVVEAINPSTIDNTERNTTIGIIVDNDPLVIGFNQSSLTFDEPSRLVREQIYLVKENNRPTEQRFDVRINLGTIAGTIGSATEDEDYITDLTDNTIVLSFLASLQNVAFNLGLLPDDIAEGNEGFILTSSPDGDPRYTLPSPGSTIFRDETVVIRDDDPIIIGFEEPHYTVNEGESVMVCINVSNPPVEFPLSLSESLLLSGTPIPGNAGSSDYRPSSLLYFVSSSMANMPMARTFCVAIMAAADGIPENNEYFDIALDFFSSSPDRVILQPSLTQVWINSMDDSGIRVNDTVIGDPLYTVPIRVPQEQLDALNLNKLSLCYEIHGKSEQWFNLVTDDCASVNTRYTMLSPTLNIMDAVAVRAVDEVNQCVNIRVDMAECTAIVGSNSLNVMSKYESNGIMVKRYRNRVRISVPNCQDLTLVMWVICENRTLDSSGSMLTSQMIKFVVMRGLNFGHRQAHGLLGQFWNIPVSIAPYTGLLSNGDPAVSIYVVNITTSGVTRSYTGSMHTSTWDNSEGPCLFVGNGQSGPIAEVRDPNDPVIESLYTNYEVKEPFSEDEDYKFRMFDESRCTAGPIMN